MRYAEYCQQIEHLKMSIEDIKCVLEQKRIRYAFIVHDKDTLEDGTPKKPHIHIMMDFLGTSWTPETLCKWFNDEPSHIEKPKSKRNRFVFQNMCSYLIHETETADGKYKYEPSQVTSNFDFGEYIESIRTGVTESKLNRHLHPLSEQLILITDNKIPKIKIDEYIGALDQIKYAKDIKNAYDIRDRRLAKEIDRDMNVMYFFGSSGTGKTTWAKYLATDKNYSIFVSGSSNDPLQGYLGQECIILDDIRGSDWKINDLLKFIDNNTNSLVKSRYSNKLLNDCKLIILTSVLSIEGLYQTLANNDSEPIEQLKRRCTDYIEFTIDTLKCFKYDDNIKDYVLSGELPNMTSQLLYMAKHKTSLIDDIERLSNALKNEPF